MIRLKHCSFAATAALTVSAACSAPDNGQDQPQRQMVGDFVAAQPSTSSTGEGSADGEDVTRPPDPGGPVAVVTPDSTANDVVGEVILDSELVPEEDQKLVCDSSSTGTSLVRVVLSFVFDVSASMGSHAFPYHSRAMKWEPVVAATKTFFADPESAGVSATLTFFPNDQAPFWVPNNFGGGAGGGGDAPAFMQQFGGGVGGVGAEMAGDECESGGYAAPDVGLTPLPSNVFSDAIDAVTPVDDTEWRLGTPTGPALEGTIQSIRDMQAADPNSKYVIVLVTDGDPALCDAQTDDINAVAGVVADVVDEINTYVIGVANPATDEDPDPPDDTGNLHQIAQAGGTEQAFIIDTNDPAQTSADFRAVIDAIRENSFGCSLEIPAPPEGKEFNQDEVNVNYANALGETPFVYDPTCTEQFAWHYDDPANPTVIQMCDAVCEAIKADFENEGNLNVEFGCVRRIPGVN